MRTAVIVALASASLTGCAAFSPNQVAKPTTITLDEALTDVVTAFAKAKQAGKDNNVRLGIAPCSVTITFNVTASATQVGKLVLDATIKAPAPITAGGGITGEQDVGSSAARGNIVTMILTSELCLPPNTSGANLFANIGKPPQANENAKAAGKKPIAQQGPASPTAVLPGNPNSIFEGGGDKHILLK